MIITLSIYSSTLTAVTTVMNFKSETTFTSAFISIEQINA